MTVLPSSRMNIPELILTLTYSDTNTRAHTHSHTKPSVTRASGCSAPALMEGLTSAMPSYFHPPQIFRQPEEKGHEKNGKNRSMISYFLLCKPLTHFILLPNLQGPGTTYSVMRRWEWSLQHSLELSGETVKNDVFVSYYHLLPSCHSCLCLNCHCKCKTLGWSWIFISIST